MIAGSNWDEADDPSLRYVLVNAQFFFPVDAARPAPAGNAVFETPHPLQYRPYQYDDRKPEARALLRSADLSIRLLERAR